MRRSPLIALFAAAFFVLCAGVSDARAQNRVDAQHKGAIGLSMLGAELGLTIPCAFGYDETWSLVTFPIVGAAGGAVGGYYLDRAGSPAASVSVLAAGLVFVIPTVMITVSATRYSTRDLRQDSRTARAAPPLPSHRSLAGSGMMRLYDGEWHFSSPGVSIQQIQRLNSDDQLVTSGLDVRFAIVSGAF